MMTRISLDAPVEVPAKVFTHWRITTMRYQANPNPGCEGKFALNINLNRCTDDGEIEQDKPINLNIWDMDTAAKIEPLVAELQEAATRVAAEVLKIEQAKQVNNG